MKNPRRILHIFMMWALRANIPVPPYLRRNALIVETVGRRSGKQRRTPVGYLEDNGRLVVIAEHGAKADWVRNALGQGGRLRIYLGGHWRYARLRILEGDPEPYLAHMDRRHGALVRRFATRPSAVEIIPE